MPAVLPHVLAVDDDADLRSVIAQYLSQNELRVTAVASGAEMDRAMEKEVFDCLLLDLKLPGEDGLAIAHRLRGHSSIPILMVTGRSDEVDRVMGLELGADDYLTKPFSLRELLARIRALLRRVKLHATLADEVGKLRAYRFEGWELNLRLRRLKSPDGKVMALPNGEFSLLTALLSSPQRVLSRGQLIEQSHLYDDEVYDRSIDVQILRLRRKIEADPAQPRFIVTERGTGYMFAVPVQVL
ncbi:response regulator [Ramlibacter sp. G-1-2-2]|uniref:Response regulator n=1 Tax=Ramlibacter agri TaxID=2728837 RepID=A0A848H9T8_9BURK|nr:response regulator [Ramlibacter agri]NML46200.1 response regulator [Ramlibacter agri]